MTYYNMIKVIRQSNIKIKGDLFFMKLTNKEKLILLTSVIVVCALSYLVWHNHTTQSEKLQQATIMSERQATNNNYLQNELRISKQNADMLADAVRQAQTGQLRPVNNFTIVAPSTQLAMEQVADRINSGDKTLPPVALEKTDRTVVAEQPTNKEFPVGVYKINNYRNWEWSVGFGQHGDDNYIPVGLQRNYSKNRALEVEIHLDASNVKKINGWEVKQVWKTDKLFVIF